MRKRNKHPEPFILLFPWGKVVGIVLLFIFASLFVYRLSETGGNHITRACLAAIITAAVAGGFGLYAIGKMWRKQLYWVLIGAMIAAVIRLLISGVGTAIITIFTDIHRSWYVVFLAFYYIAFLVLDTGLVLWILRHCDVEKQENDLNGNGWDYFS